MKIISKFKDYYDYLSHIYGQDSKITWERHLEDYIPYDTPNILKKGEVDLSGVDDHTMKYEFCWVIVCGKRFLFFRKSEYPKENWTAYKNSEEVKEYLSLAGGKNPRRKWSYFTKKQPEYFMGEFSQKNLDFCVKHKSPVIVVYGYRFTTDSPILGDIPNFVSLYPAEQIYQDISYFLLNQVNGSPDIDPPVVLDDKFKIDYHGFDKYSFRPKMRKRNE